MFTFPLPSTSAFKVPCSVNSYSGQLAKCLSRYVSSSSLTIPSQFTSPYNLVSVYGNTSYPSQFAKCLVKIRRSLLFTLPLQSTSAFKAPCSVNSYSGQFAKCLVKYSTSALSTTPSQFTSPYSTEVDGFTGNVSYPAIPSICLNIINASASSIFLSSLTSAFTLPCGASGYPSIPSKLFCRYSTSALSTILSQFTSPYNTDNIGLNGNVSYPGQFAKCLANIIPSLLFTLPSLSKSAFIHPCSVNSYPGQFAKCLSRYVSSSSLTIPSQFTSP